VTALDLLTAIVGVAILLSFSTAMLAALNYMVDSDFDSAL
jgi:hypothetical protein